MPSNPEQLILEARRLVESDKRSEIRLNANGGNSLLIVCDPHEELLFVEKAKDLLPTDAFKIIDLNQCLLDFISDNLEFLEEQFNDLQSSTHEIFKGPSTEVTVDLYKGIMSMIDESFDANKVPVLIHTGSLYGTGIHNIHFMEHELVMKSPLPIIIVYPATMDQEKLLFLGKKPSSKYRCMIIK
jgi:hypothetical protein